MATLFSLSLHPQVLLTTEVVPGHLLHLRVWVQGIILNLVNVYAPARDLEMARFYWQVATYLGTLSPQECLVLSRDFNVILEAQDHTGREWSQASSGRSSWTTLG